MSFFDFIDTSFILTLGLILLISGGIMLYCYRRLNILENSIIEHGKILHNFITNYNCNMAMSNNLSRNEGTDNMVGSDTHVHNENNCGFSSEVNNGNMDEIQLNNEKIMVSDDDSDESDDDDSDDNDDSDGDENGDYSGHVKRVKHVEDVDDNNDVIKDITDKTNDNNDNNNNKNMEKLSIASDNDDDDDDDDGQLVISNINDLFAKKLEVSGVPDSTLSKLINLNEANAGGEDAKKSLTRLRVDELREMAVTRNLTSNNDVSKYKKNDLIKMLQQ